MNKVFQWKKGQDAFLLSFEYLTVSEKLHFSSNIPHRIVGWLEVPAISDEQLFPVTDLKRVDGILEYMALQIFKNPLSRQYYFPDCYLKGNKLIENIWEQESLDYELFQKGRQHYVSINSSPLVCNYIYTIIRNKVNFNTKGYELQRITRGEFEMQYGADKSFELGEYLDLYFQLNKFIELKCSTERLTFIAGLNRANRVLISFVFYVE